MLVRRFFSAVQVATKHRWPVMLAYATICVFSGVTAFLLRFELEMSEQNFIQMLWATAIWVTIKLLVFRLLSLDRVSWRLASIPDLLSIALTNIVSSCLAVPIIYVVAPPSFPRSVFLLDLLLCSYLTSVLLLIPRLIGRHWLRRNNQSSKRVLIYGAGKSGATLVSEILESATVGYTVIGFLDDDGKKCGMRVHGKKVLGTSADLVALVRTHQPKEVLVAIPSITPHQMTRVLEYSREAGIACRTIPALQEVLNGQTLTKQIRNVAVEDLLERAPIRLEQPAIRKTLENAVVLVTGAGGSIGSELCRQIARFKPGTLLALDIAETPLFEIDAEIRRTHPEIHFRCVVGNIRQRQSLNEILRKYKPSILFHAAAYKHVPMMEAHLFEAIENNVIGTLNVALAAAENNVSEFVMISSDKAVRPSSVMGATKRIAELIVKSLHNGSTKFVSVRFGNVLGSNGSVVPVFKQQIAAGGPVTVTHPEMQRFFMTIPEASQLVLQAATMGKGGEIFVLDMGAPVLIQDLARKLILLSGLQPDRDINIVFTGIRPGEKLYEELSSYEENTCPTHHEKIKVFMGPNIEWNQLQKRISTIRELCELRDAPGLLLVMKELILEYNPSLEMLKLMVSRPESLVRSERPEWSASAASA
jgi:FlaA1/EpsC-like NDP-sugar epimerase